MKGFVVKLPKTSVSSKKRDFDDHLEAQQRRTGSKRVAKSLGLQTRLSFGQKTSCAVTECGICGMGFSANDSEDIERHNKYCKERSSLIVLPSLTGCKIVAEGEQGSVIRVDRESLSKSSQSLEHVLRIMQEDLDTDRQFMFGASAMFFWIDTLRRVVSVVALDEVAPSRTAVLRSYEQVSQVLSTTACDHTPSDFSSRSLQLFMGVRLMWTHRSRRRQGLMMRLLDIARAQFVFGQRFSREEVAFSQPTADGFEFAKHIALGEGREWHVDMCDRLPFIRRFRPHQSTFHR